MPAPLPDASEKPPRRSALGQFSQYSGLAFTLPAAVFVGFGFGYMIDRHWHTGKTFEIILTIVGFAAGFLEVVRVANRK